LCDPTFWKEEMYTKENEVAETIEETQRRAKRALKLWMKEHVYHQVTNHSWTRWTYGERPFWTTYAFAVSSNCNPWLLGFNIYDDGEIVCVSREPKLTF